MSNTPPAREADRSLFLCVVIACAKSWLPTCKQMAEGRRTIAGRLKSRADLLERAVAWYLANPGENGPDVALLAEAEAILKKILTQLP
ncbi:MAG: hypothetical protein AB7G75_29885 [Candidatus Binatia bacterium]